MSSMSVDGLVSGLNTSDLISQLMQAESIPQTQLKSKVRTHESVVSAFQAVNAKFSALLNSAKDLSLGATWQAMKATSSSTSATAVSATGATAGQVSFVVSQLAKAESQVSADFADVADILTAPDSKITLTNSKGSQSFDASDLNGLVKAINDDTTLGLSAAAVQVSPGRYRLQVTAKETGAASEFTMSGVSSSTQVQQGLDAEIYLGGTATGVKVASSTNTFTGLMSGTNVTVADVTVDPGAGTEKAVTVTVANDREALNGKVKSLVDAANAALSEISKYSTKFELASGVLVGNSTVRQLSSQVLQTVSSGLSGGLAPYGVSLTREGKLAFDGAKFDTAYAANPAATQAAFRTGVQFSAAAGIPAGGVQVTGNGLATLVGDRDVVVTRAATRSVGTVGATGAATSVADGSKLTVMMGTTSVSVTAVGTETLASIAARLNTEVAGIGASVTYDATNNVIVVTANNYGSGPTLGLSGTGDFGPASVTAGEDVQGSVGGVAATGSGQLLTSGDGVMIEVSLDAAQVAAATGGLVGSVSFSAGLAERLQAVADGATNADTGTLTTAIQGRDQTIKDTNARIADWDRRLELRRTALSRQFSAMEVALSKLNQQSSWLAGQIAGLPSYG